MIIKAAYLTNYGNNRLTNEDGVLLHNMLITQKDMKSPGFKILEGDRILLCVADGMGGHVSGELASESVLSYIRDNQDQLQSAKTVRKTIVGSKFELNRIAMAENAYGLGTTLSGVLLRKDKALVFSSGDSRVYRIEKRYLEKITTDHSLVQNLYNVGAIDEEGMRSHPHKNILSSAIIGDLSHEEPEVFIKEISLKVGSQLLICTDGLWESLSNDELMDATSKDGDIELTSTNLLKSSLEKWGKDNISFILFQVVDI
ncbi:MAG: PP2C family serine/threonine-protein phosphatase [Leptospiraceae bacterium]|nr:PP2C family serine/threonine-protein phosphatase [Leptospiraceae bacterium]